MRPLEIGKVGFLGLSLLILNLYFGGSVGGCGETTDSSSDSSSLSLTSDDITSGGTIASTFALGDCGGSNSSPQLSWSGTAPSGTKSYAVTVLDEDASDFIHWLVYNISSSTTSISRGSVPSGASQAPNDFGSSEYGGPCPPSGETHDYVFKVWALDVEDLTTVSGVQTGSGNSVLSAIQNHDLGSASFKGKFTGP